jgi:sarcosine oxidase, subunit delta
VLLICCPFCGDRDEREFQCAGESHVVRPDPVEAASDAHWADYLYYHRNPRGVVRERWCHVLGCRQWFNVARDTLTHEVLEVYAMGSSGPEV